MRKYLLLLLMLCFGCTKPVKFHYGDVVSWKETPSEKFEFYHCKEKLGTIIGYSQDPGLFFPYNEYLVNTGAEGSCREFYTHEDNLVKEGVSKL